MTASPTILANGTELAAVGQAVESSFAVGAPLALTLLSTTGYTSFEWVVMARPFGSTATLTSATGFSSSLTTDMPGKYRIRGQANGGEVRRDVEVIVALTTTRSLRKAQGGERLAALVEKYNDSLDILDAAESVLADLSVTTAKLAAAAVTTAKIAAGTIVDSNISTSAAIDGSKLDFGTRTVRFWGDSITAGTANPIGEPAAYRGEFFRLTRIGGDDFVPLGTLYAWGAANGTGVGVRRHTPGLSRHEGVSGNTIAQVTARISAAVATELARTGTACDIEFVMAGTNDVSGGSSATMLTNMGLLIDALRTANPTGYIIVCSIPRYTAYAATRTAFNSGLSALVATKDSRVLYLDTCSDFTRTDHGTIAGPAEDPHPSRRGLMKIASRMYERARLLFPLRSGRPSPRGYAARLTQASLDLTAGANGFQRTGGAFETGMGTASWLAAVSVYYSSLPGANASLIGFGSPYNSGGFAIVQNASGAAGLYGTGSGSALISAVFAAKAGAWLRYWASWNATSKILSFWGAPNGVPVLFNAGVVDQAWSSAYAYLIIGSGDIAAPTAYLEQAEFCVGTGVPAFDDLPQYIERNWYEGVPLPGLAAHFPMDEGTGSAIADACGGSAPVLVGSVAWATQAHDWDG